MGKYSVLTPQQAEFFLEYGYVVIKEAFTIEKAAEWSYGLWVRLGLDPNDKLTWTRERIHMPWHKREPVSTFSPKAWEAMQDLLGRYRIDEQNSTWGDSFILNFGLPDHEGDDKVIHPHDFDNWHVDGDFFVHYLDSPEQALLVIPLFSDIDPRGGGTYICPEGIDLVARYLASHPEGLLPIKQSFVPSTTTYADPLDDPKRFFHPDAARRCSKFAEMIGKTGDVVLMHPLMLHSASKNHLRNKRVIINPPVALKEPFNFNRENPEDFSLVELKTLRALGVDRLDFKPTTERRRILPASTGLKSVLLEEEKKRLAAWEEKRRMVKETMAAP
ncbi:hypothetical protein BDY19DRAFT_958273 [Irpex rosettiformis]|uniref:Uncharacterized protein n=1 Tax=Irpex rosettiformis TaxID=378272 RepID=A0ACB8TYV2_9APHY|nr:hypothetical protein BDY19DRAFT_958273 [Irpex rosettiformis]